MPGMTRKRMPAAASAEASSQPRPNTNGSPPFSRRTRRAARARSIRISLMSRLLRRRPAAALAGEDQFGALDARAPGCADRPGRRARSSSAVDTAWSASTVSSPGSPGPAPASQTSPGGKSGSAGKLSGSVTCPCPGSDADRQHRRARCRGSVRAPSTLPTRISAVRSIGVLAISAAIVPSVRADDPFVGPARAIDDRDRAVRAVERHERGDDLVDGVDRQMNGKRRPGRGEGFERFARGHRRGAARGPGQHHRLRQFGQGQFLAERGGGGGEGRHARRDGVGNAGRVEPAKLFAERTPDREIARMKPRHVLAARRSPAGTRPRSRRATSARCRRCARPAGNGRAAPWAPASPRRGRPARAR